MSSGFSFGSNTSAPNFGGTNTLSFGAQAQPSAGNQLGFGVNNAQQPPSGFQLGSSLSKPTNAVAPQPTGFSFGTPNAAATTSALSFGATPAPTATSTPGLNLGASTGTPGFSIGGLTSAGVSQANPAAGGLNLGGITTATPSLGAPTLSFGLGSTASTSNAPTSLSTGFTLGGATTSAAPLTSTGFTLGGPVSSAAPAQSLNFGLKTTANSITATPSTGLTFGTASTAAPTLGFGLTTNTSSAPGGLNFGTSAAPTSFSLSTPAASAAPTRVGLGGIQTSTSTTLGTTTAKEIPPKEQQVPNEIQQEIENFKNYIKQQKIYSSDVSRCCVKDFRSVESQVGVLNNVIKEIESQLERNRSLAEKLKYDTAQGLQLLEMAQRTQDTPAGLQYENQAPMNFFLSLADQFEKEMHALKIQIENTDKYVKNFGQSATLTSQDLSLGMKRLHDTFVALAGRLQSVHTQVESQKEFFINLRKQLANDFSNPFESLDKKLNPNQTTPTTVNHGPPRIACGPTPFNQIMTSNFPIMSQQNVGSPYPGMGPSTGFGSSNAQNLFGNTSSLNQLHTNLQNTSFSFQNSTLGTNFQLQKPPTGNKRGKQ